MIVTDRETWDRWNETGEWVLFRAADFVKHPTPDYPYHEFGPPAEFVEWAKPCETCGGSGRCWCGCEDCAIAPADRCGHCLDGKRRIAITVPCETCGGTGCSIDHCQDCGDEYYEPCLHHEDHPHWELGCEDEPCCPNCDDGLVTVGHVVVEWGPWLVRDGDEWHAGLTPDPATLVGQYAIGGKVVKP